VLPGGGDPRGLMEELAKTADNGPSVGVLDCSASLPSKKTTYTKLGLDKTKAPVMFISANGKKATQVPVEKISLASLTRIVRKATAARLTELTSDELFRKACWQNDKCVLIVTHGALDEPHKTDIARLMREYSRGLLWASMDSSELRIVSSPMILKKGEPEPRANKPLMVVFERSALLNVKGKTDGQYSLAASVSRGSNFTLGGEAAQLLESVQKGSKRKSALGQNSEISLTEAPSLVFKNEKKAKEREERKLARAKAKAVEDAAKRQKEKEIQRRAEMDKEAEAALGIEEVTDGAEGGATGADNDGEKQDDDDAGATGIFVDDGDEEEGEADAQKDMEEEVLLDDDDE